MSPTAAAIPPSTSGCPRPSTPRCDRDYAPLQRLVAADKLRTLGYLSFDPTQISFAGQAATTLP